MKLAAFDSMMDQLRSQGAIPAKAPAQNQTQQAQQQVQTQSAPQSILTQPDAVAYVLDREAANSPDALRKTFMDTLRGGGVSQTARGAGANPLQRKIAGNYAQTVGNASGDFERSLAEESQKRLGTYNQLADARVRNEMAQAQNEAEKYNAEVARKSARNAAILGLAGTAGGALIGGPAGAAIGSGIGQGIGGGGLL